MQLLNAVAGVINDEGLMVNCTPTKNEKADEFFEAMDLNEFDSPNANGENASPNVPRMGTLLGMLEQNMSQLKRRHSWVEVGSNDASWAINNESLVDIENENYMPAYYRFGCEEGEGEVTAIQLIDDKTFLEVNPPSEPVYMKPRAKKEEARKATTTTRLFDATTATTTTLLLH